MFLRSSVRSFIRNKTIREDSDELKELIEEKHKQLEQGVLDGRVKKLNNKQRSKDNRYSIKGLISPNKKWSVVEVYVGLG